MTSSMSAAQYALGARGSGITEHAIQKTIVDYLRRVLPDDVRVVAIPNKPRSRRQGALEKARGSVAGVPDLILTGRIHAMIEVKREASYLRAEQREWRDFCGRNQVPYAVVRSVEDVRSALADWGVLTKEAGR